MDAFSYANLANAKFIEDLYAQYLQDPESVDLTWRRFFDGVQFGAQTPGQSPKQQLEEADLRVYFLIDAYRRYGYRLAEFNPLFENPLKELDELSLQNFHLTHDDLEKEFPTYGFLDSKSAALKDIIAALQNTYTGSIGIEYMHIKDEKLRNFIAANVEPTLQPPLSPDEKKRILSELNHSEILESFIHRKYQGQKRFSLEGGETFIPMLIEMISLAAEKGVDIVSIAMAHRGRLNVLSNVLGKSFAQIFYEFEDFFMPDLSDGSGDVKYHMGYSNRITTDGGKSITVELEANPSHLESVNPVQQGRVRAFANFVHGGDAHLVLPITIHGDAAISGQGVVYETLQMQKLEGYGNCGTVHIVINNQIGFTATDDETRSTEFCTDIAHTFDAPIFHVNAENPESCVQAAKLALLIRQEFAIDTFIDMLCYRKYGHNETDEPAYTQPCMYCNIQNRPLIRDLYRDILIKEGVLSQQESTALEVEFKSKLEKAAEETKDLAKNQGVKKEKTPKPQEPITRVPRNQLIELMEKACQVPQNFAVHKKLGKLYQDRVAFAKSGEAKLDWGACETLAYATLLKEGISIRISGEDSQRGTFSHRQATLVDQNTSEHYTPLSHLCDTPFDVYNSHLSEMAVLGFEFGYGLVAQNGLNIWEAQFGDFANGAQIIIDQYICSSEMKWGVVSNLALFLPHGYEGMGPEHSSARIERYLQLASDKNMRIIVPSNAAQFFHLIRRHALTTIKKPLIVFTPKKTLRFPPTLASIDELANGEFQLVIDDTEVKEPEKIILCSGKVYYDLIEERKKREAHNVAIVRLEQLYPLPKEELQKYASIKNWVWVQEEHRNMGAWSYINEKLSENRDLCYVGRRRSASTAAGSHALHEKEKQEFLAKAFDAS